jgi:hypothetical protein
MAYAQMQQEGIQNILQVALSELQSPLGAGAFYIGLCTDATLVKNGTLTTLTEVTGTGYARQPVASSAVGFPSDAAVSNNAWHLATLTVTFTAGGTWTGAVAAFLCTVSSGTSGKLICAATLSATRTLVLNDTLNVSFDITWTG